MPGYQQQPATVGSSVQSNSYLLRPYTGLDYAEKQEMILLQAFPV